MHILIILGVVVFVIVKISSSVKSGKRQKEERRIQEAENRQRIQEERQKKIEEEKQQEAEARQRKAEEEKQKSYAKTNLGKIDNFKSVVLQKREEMRQGIVLIEKDIQRHKDYVQSLNKELSKKQLGFIEDHIKEQISQKQGKEKALGLYIEIIEDSIEETKTIENALGVLFKTVKFNEESTTLQEYDEKYNKLDESVTRFGQYDFVDFSNDFITHIEEKGLNDEVNLDRIMLQMEVEKDKKPTVSQPNGQDGKPEELLLDNIDESFSELVKRFKSFNLS